MNYSIYIIEQSGPTDEPFNRAKLFNVGVIEGIFYQEIRNDNLANGSQKVCYCIILHDVDMLPVRISMELIFENISIKRKTFA